MFKYIVYTHFRVYNISFCFFLVVSRVCAFLCLKGLQGRIGRFTVSAFLKLQSHIDKMHQPDDGGHESTETSLRPFQGPKKAHTRDSTRKKQQNNAYRHTHKHSIQHETYEINKQRKIKTTRIVLKCLNIVYFVRMHFELCTPRIPRKSNASFWDWDQLDVVIQTHSA